MNRFYQIVLILFFLSATFSLVEAQVNRLSEEAEISLLTFGPGPALYTVFGHSAIRVNDPRNRIDLMFNYGTFDFSQENFYWRFIRGDIYYWLSVTRAEGFIDDYKANDQSIREQVLNLDQEQKQKVWDFLVNNAMPENRFYFYDFFLDNCATRIKDLVYLTTPFQLSDTVFQAPLSFREATDMYLQANPWGDLGIDIGLGSPSDRKMKPEEYMYLPDYLYLGFKYSKDAQGRPLVARDELLFQDLYPLEGPWFTPAILFVLLLIAAIWWSWKQRKYGLKYRLPDNVLFILLGIMGIVLLFLWFGTRHVATAYNQDLLWVSPLYFFLLGNRERRWKKILAFIQLGLILICLFIFVTGLVYFNPYLWIFWLLIFLRLIIYIAEYRHLQIR
jgi:hypothetical protein